MIKEGRFIPKMEAHAGVVLRYLLRKIPKGTNAAREGADERIPGHVKGHTN
jgi:hypothetical protein